MLSSIRLYIVRKGLMHARKIGQIEEFSFLDPVQKPEIAAKKQRVVDVLCRE